MTQHITLEYIHGLELFWILDIMGTKLDA